MRKIHYTSTLFYYDGPQIFEARDAIGGHYLALMVPRLNGNERYLVVGIEPEKLRQFRQGFLDLRTLLINSDEEERYLTTVTNDLDDLLLHPLDVPLVGSPFLPKRGLILHERQTADSDDDLVINEARERNNLVLKVTIEPPEAARGPRIRTDTYSALLLYVQNLIKHAYTVARKASPSPIRLPNDDMMDVVVPAVPGSFQFVLEASAGSNLFGNNDLEDALRQIDTVFGYTRNTQELINHMKAIRGHFPGSYLRLLRLLVEKDTGLRYSWAEPNSEKPSQNGVSYSQAESLVGVLSSVKNLAIESITIEGYLDKFDRRNGNWALFADDGGRRFGKLREEGPNLDGLTVHARYRFHCDEEVDAVEATGRELRTLYLNSYEYLE